MKKDMKGGLDNLLIPRPTSTLLKDDEQAQTLGIFLRSPANGVWIGIQISQLFLFLFQHFSNPQRVQLLTLISTATTCSISSVA